MNRKTWMMMLAVGLALDMARGEADGLRFQAALSGTNLVPDPVRTPTRGQARFSFAGNGSRLSYRLQLRKGAAIRGARLHCASANATGPVVAELLGPVAGGWNGSVDIAATLTGSNLTGGAHCVAAIGRPIADLTALAGAMAEGLVYVDAVSARFPDGVVRGQAVAVSAPPPPQSSSTVAPQNPARRPKPKIIVNSTPYPPSVYAGTGAIPLRLAAPLPMAGIPAGAAAISITGGYVLIPISVLGTPYSGFTSTNLLVNVPDIALTVPGSNFSVSQFSLGLPPSSFTFEPTMNPPFPTTTFTLPATAANFQAVIQAAGSGWTIPAIATLSFPAMTFSPRSPFPGGFTGSLIIGF